MLVGENYPNYIYIIFAKISKSVTNSNKICNKSKCLDGGKFIYAEDCSMVLFTLVRTYATALCIVAVS